MRRHRQQAMQRSLTLVISHESISISKWTSTTPQERAARLHQVWSDAKVLILLREQESWLYSLYQQSTKYHFTNLPLTQYLEEYIAHMYDGYCI